MGRTSRQSKGKVINPTFFVFCEGKSEETYVKYLRACYRLPIEVVPKVSDSNISNKFIQNCKRQYESHPKDQTFLMFDLDVEGMYQHLSSIPNATLICSNPCIEFWLLLHYTDQKSAIDALKCIREFKKHEPQYEKGYLTNSLKEKLLHCKSTAMERARKLVLYHNPSSSVYRFIEELEKVKGSE